MRRRTFLKIATTAVITGAFAPRALAEIVANRHNATQETYDDHIKDYIHKMRNFNAFNEDDICLDRKEYRILEQSMSRLKRLERTVGHGNFQLLDFDDALKFARNYSQVGGFTRAELDFLEMVFHKDASLYGFLGEKPLKNITDSLPHRSIVKVPRTGNYVYKGLPLDTYKRIRRDVGNQAILISGVRSVVKQILLFLNKAYKNKGNLSLASRSLAPPGFSFHGVGDFDVGQVGLGAANFTERFITTEVYSRIIKLDYVTLRYGRNNLLGVRFEPWHIKVT